MDKVLSKNRLYIILVQSQLRGKLYFSIICTKYIYVLKNYVKAIATYYVTEFVTARDNVI